MQGVGDSQYNDWLDHLPLNRLLGESIVVAFSFIAGGLVVIFSLVDDAIDDVITFGYLVDDFALVDSLVGVSRPSK